MTSTSDNFRGEMAGMYEDDKIVRGDKKSINMVENVSTFVLHVNDNNNNKIIYRDTGSSEIHLTEDKLRLYLDDYTKKIKEENDWKKNDWTVPLGIFTVLATTLITTDFKKVILPSDTWMAIFIIGGFLSFLWLIRNIIHTLKNNEKITVNKLIKDIKEGVRPYENI